MNTPEPKDGQPKPKELPPTDEALMDDVKARNIQAFSLLFDRYVRPVHALAVHLLGQTEAEEVVQGVFWRVWHHANQFEPAKGSARVWILAIARHQVIDALKRRSREQQLIALGDIEKLLADVPANQVDVDEVVWDRQQAEAMHLALNELPDEQRRVMILAYFGGLSQSDIAAQLGWPLGTVKKRVRLALQKLRTFMLHRNKVG